MTSQPLGIEDGLYFDNVLDCVGSVCFVVVSMIFFGLVDVPVAFCSVSFAASVVCAETLICTFLDLSLNPEKENSAGEADSTIYLKSLQYRFSYYKVQFLLA